MRKLTFSKKQIVLFVILILILVTLATKYYGSTDTGDYADSAKFFSGKFKADIRNSHSYFYGLLNAPFVYLFDSYLGFKLISLISLIAIIFSIYLISGRNSKALWLILVSPAIWYMAPWINPIQLSSLFLLWGFYFINVYDKNEKSQFLIYSGIFLGLGWAVWDTIMFFAVILSGVFLWDKKVYGSIFLAIGIIAGLFPRLVLDYLLFNFPFYTIFKSLFGTLANLTGGIYNSGYSHTVPTPVTLLLVFLTIPLFFWPNYKKKNFRHHKKSLTFIAASLLLILANLQLRYLLAVIPIIVLISSQNISERNFKRQIVISSIVVAIVIFPYILQIGSLKGPNLLGIEVTSAIASPNDLLDSQEISRIIYLDIEEITSEYPNQAFLVGNSPDDYRKLAYLYWGSDVEEFVSIQDYELIYQENNKTVYSRRFEPVPNINERRQIWIEGGMDLGESDNTEYNSINYAIGLGEPISYPGYVSLKKYGYLYLSKRTDK